MTKNALDLNQLAKGLPTLQAIRAERAKREDERRNSSPTYDWRRLARPEQITPSGDWRTWVILAGRGWGKTRTGAECVNAEVEAGRARRIAITAETAADARDVIVEGPSGFLSIGPPNKRPHYESSKRRLTWPNGAIATLYNATEPDQLRGPQHDFAWCDELAKWAYSKPGSAARSPGQETWDNLQFGLRMGAARCVVTTTPRPVPLIRALLAAPRTFITRGTTMDNAANLSPEFVESIKERYGGTRLGRQELEAELLDDVPGALWHRGMFEVERFRLTNAPLTKRVVVSIDPSGARGADDDQADSIGIVVAAIGDDGRGYLLADLTCRLSPKGWGGVAVRAYRDFEADRIIAERNFGGAMVEHVIRSIDANVSFKEVTASRGRLVRAEPIAALYEQGRISHVGPQENFEMLEAQMCAMTSTGYIGEGSPDRVDAAVWAFQELMIKDNNAGFIEFYRRENEAAAAAAKAARQSVMPTTLPVPSTFAASISAPKSGMIALQGKPWNEACGRDRRFYRAGADGIIYVDPEDVTPFVGAGYVRV